MSKPMTDNLLSSTQERWRHKKRGTTYAVIGEAELQLATSTAIDEGAALTIYRDEDGNLWARPTREFNDGRFERVSDGSLKGQDAQRLDPTDDSAVPEGQTPTYENVVSPDGATTILDRNKTPHPHPSHEYGELLAAMRAYEQADEEGVMVLVSRQACDEAATALERQQSRIKEMEKALEPFAEIAEELSVRLRDDDKNTMAWAVPTVGDFRRARAALTKEEAGNANAIRSLPTP